MEWSIMFFSEQRAAVAGSGDVDRRAVGGLYDREYDLPMALTASVIIAAVTFVICIGGLLIGKKFGMKLPNKASILGGVILIAIGIEIFITGII